MAYKARHHALPDVAEERGVEWLLLASIARVGTEIRVAAQLVEASSDENRWARSYVRRCRNVLSTQADVAASVARAVGAVLAPKGAAARLSAAG